MTQFDVFVSLAACSQPFDAPQRAHVLNLLSLSGFCCVEISGFLGQFEECYLLNTATNLFFRLPILSLDLAPTLRPASLFDLTQSDLIVPTQVPESSPDPIKF